MRRFLLLLLPFILFTISSQAQQTAAVPGCAGVDDSAKLTAIKAALGSTLPRTIKLPTGKTCRLTSDFTLTANITFDGSEGGLLELANGVTFNPQGPVNLPIRPVFVNAAAGQGTVSFAGNTVLKEVSSQWWGTNTNVSVQAAVNSLDSALGGRVKLIGSYTFTQNVNVISKSNVEIAGEGIGRTIINGATIAEANRTGGAQFSGASGTVAFTSSATGTTATNNSIRDLTILGPTTMGGCTFGSVLCGHSLTAVNQSNFVAERIELNGSVGETFYIIGYTGMSNNLRILNSNFKNVLSANATGVVDTNSTQVVGLTIENCHFEDVYFAIDALGRNIRIANNSLLRVSNFGIAVAETNDDLTGSLFGAVVTGNVFSYLGTGATAAGTRGIDVRSRTPLYDNDKQDFGTVISNNVFVNNVIDNVANSLVCISLTGSATVNNNYASGIDTAANTSSTFLLWNGAEEAPNRIYLNSNVVQRTLAANNFSYGFAIAQTADTFVYLSGNNIATEVLPIYITPGTHGDAGTQPYISFNGDIFTGGDLSFLVSGGIDASGELDDTPLYGDTTSGVRTASSLGIAGMPTLAESATPSVKGKSIVLSSFASPTTVTNFTHGVTGQNLTVWCNNANMTLGVNSNLIINGSFTCAQFKTITLFRRGADWLEIGRSTFLTAPGAIGGTTAAAGTFTTVVANTSLAINGGTALTTTNRTGTGNLVLANTPTLITPNIGVAAGTSLVINGGTALTTTNQTGTGNLVLANTPTLITPNIGVATGTSVVTAAKLSSTGGVSNFSKGTDVASAATIAATGNVFHVTGTTNITSVSGSGIAAGTRLTIIFDGVLTFTDGSNLKLAGDFVTTAGDVIVIAYDGSNWYEVSRSVN